ncbi:MAG: ATP-binding protein [Polyangiaceae bacterium]|nr:ATP-binding protein [Polyangiaceae bacterium]
MDFPLPHSIQNFPKLRKNNYWYVDKTAIIHRLITRPGCAFFLSRPRRFGKSLLCSTLEAVFEGERRLFDGTTGGSELAINSLEWGWEKHPVVHIDLSVGNYTLDGIQNLRDCINFALDVCAAKHEVQLQKESTAVRFARLIRALESRKGQPVAVIIDEYDAPLLDTVDVPEAHAQIKEELKGFYRVLKQSDALLRFVFISGITKFSHVSIFSGMNQPKDLTLDPNYAEICGFTQDEAMEALAPAIDYVVTKHGKDRDDYLDRLRRFYNGYRFSRKPVTVYNPVSLIEHLSDGGQFRCYWYRTGTPTFLIKLLAEHKVGFLDLSGRTVECDDLSDYGTAAGNPETLLFQSGYLTISDYDNRTEVITLDYPNGEVRKAFTKSLVDHYIASSNTPMQSLYSTLTSALFRGEPKQALLAMEQFLASIPYDIVGSGEKYYHTAVHLTFGILGIQCRSEVRTASGRADTIVETPDFVYCFEFKIDKPVEQAIARIDEKEYLKPWFGKGKKLFKVGVSFDSKKRNIGDSVVVEVPG